MYKNGKGVLFIKKILSFILALVVSLSAVVTYSPLCFAVTSPPYSYFPSDPPNCYDNGYNPDVAEILEKLLEFSPDQKYSLVLVGYDTYSNVYFGIALPALYSCTSYDSFGTSPYNTALIDVITFPFLQFQVNPSTIGNTAMYNSDLGKWQNQAATDTYFFINKDYFIYSVTRSRSTNYYMLPFSDSSSSTTFPKFSSTPYRYILGPACYCAVDTNYFSVQFGINEPEPYFPTEGIPSSLNYFGVDELPSDTVPETTTSVETTAPQSTQQTLPNEWFEDVTVESAEDIDVSNLPTIDKVGSTLDYLKQSISDVFTHFSSGIRFWLHSFDELVTRFDFLRVIIMAALALTLVEYIFWRL